MRHKVFCIDLEQNDIPGCTPQRVHVTPFSIGIDVAKGLSWSDYLHLDFFDRLLVELRFVLVFEMKLGVYILTELVLDSKVEQGTSILGLGRNHSKLRSYSFLIWVEYELRLDHHTLLTILLHSQGSRRLVEEDGAKVGLNDFNFTFQYDNHFVTRIAFVDDCLARELNFPLFAQHVKTLDLPIEPVWDVRDSSEETHISQHLVFLVFQNQLLITVSVNDGEVAVSDGYDGASSRLAGKQG